jgi:Sulfite exporter TauE/SafE
LKYRIFASRPVSRLSDSERPSTENPQMHQNRQKLLFLFSLVMGSVGLAMLRPRAGGGDPAVRISPSIAARLLGVGFLAGAISGFFGIGSGFLIVPGIMLGSGMPILNAIGSSLISVSAFGFTTAASYAISGMIDWRVATEFIVGGALGGVLGIRLASRFGARRRLAPGLLQRTRRPSDKHSLKHRTTRRPFIMIPRRRTSIIRPPHKRSDAARCVHK